MYVLSYAQVVNCCEILDFPQIVEFLEMVFCKLNVIIDNPCNKYEKVPVINTNKYSLLSLTLCFNFLISKTSNETQ